MGKQLENLWNLANFSINRQCYSKHSSLPQLTFYADVSLVSFSNTVNHGKAETEAFTLLFHAEKRIKNLRKIFLGNATARIRNLYCNQAFNRKKRTAYGETSTIRHSISGIENQIENALLELIKVT